MYEFFYDSPNLINKQTIPKCQDSINNLPDLYLTQILEISSSVLIPVLQISGNEKAGTESEIFCMQSIY